MVAFPKFASVFSLPKLAVIPNFPWQPQIKDNLLFDLNDLNTVHACRFKQTTWTYTTLLYISLFWYGMNNIDTTVYIYN